jgi:hypothetical protein
VLLAGLVAIGVGAQAQTRWTVVPKASLAWWQINPHLNHLWATTCPEEPTWRPGEGRSGGWIFDKALKPPKHGYAIVNDTTIVPLYPRPAANSVCTEAVQGQIVVTDTAAWRGVRGEVAVRAEALITGEDRRDALTRQAILETTRYPEIRFRIDSLVGVTRDADTLRATAVGVLTLRHVSKPMTAPVRAWREPAGLRVVGRLRVPAGDLVPEYGLSRFALGLGVGTKIWFDLFMGVDVVLRPEQGGAN